MIKNLKILCLKYLYGCIVLCYLKKEKITPPWKGGVKMFSNAEITEMKFDACVKKALRFELIYRKESRKNQAKRLTNFSDLSYNDKKITFRG